MTYSRKTLESTEKKNEIRSIPTLFKQSKDILHLQAEYLDAKTLGCLAATQKNALALFKEPLDQRPVRKLLRHVLCGEQKQAEDMIQLHPEILFKKDKFKIKDYAGRTFMNVSPIIAAYGAEDVDMLEMMFKYLEQDAKAQAIKQINEKFPKEEIKSYDFATLAAAITSNENVDAALKKFKKHFASGLIEQGKHFCMKNLLENAYHVYGQNDTWADGQREKFFVHVIGYLQSLLPACYAQALCQNIYKVVNGGESLKRELINTDNDSYYPTGTSYLRLGRDVAFYCYSAFHGWSIFCSLASSDGIARNARALQTYTAQKQQRLEKLFAAPSIENSEDRQSSRKRSRASFENS